MRAFSRSLSAPSSKTGCSTQELAPERGASLSHFRKRAQDRLGRSRSRSWLDLRTGKVSAQSTRVVRDGVAVETLSCGKPDSWAPTLGVSLRKDSASALWMPPQSKGVMPLFRAVHLRLASRPTEHGDSIRGHTLRGSWPRIRRGGLAGRKRRGTKASPPGRNADRRRCCPSGLLRGLFGRGSRIPQGRDKAGDLPSWSPQSPGSQGYLSRRHSIACRISARFESRASFLLMFSRWVSTVFTLR